MLRISAVSYINSLPFVYGIKHSGALKDYYLSLDIPSVCAQKLLIKEVDVGLAPIAIIPHLKEYFIFPDFCIGANGPIRSVMLHSNVPLKEIKKIYLDYQSKTSVLLVKILAKNFWKITPKWINASEGYEKKISGTVAGLIIGDRNFTLPRSYSFTFDLAEQWKLYTGFPFIFACWIANKELHERDAVALYNALKFGVENKKAVLKEIKGLNPKLVAEYLDKNVDYGFDQQKKTAMNLFLKLGKEIT
jgi:chorismate dehydratase